MNISQVAAGRIQAGWHPGQIWWCPSQGVPHRDWKALGGLQPALGHGHWVLYVLCLAKNEDLTCKKFFFLVIEHSGAGFYCIFFAEIGQQSDVLLLALASMEPQMAGEFLAKDQQTN